jgi:antibiotic biosynthesis monooxygenase (ABM) superfamily enzyme
MNEVARKPSQARFAFMILIFVYPLVTSLLYVIAALTPGWQLWQRAMVMVPIVVVCMVYVIIPFIQQRLRALIMVRACG